MLAADLILEARRRAGLTQAELAERVDRPQSTIARWESGANTPNLETVRSVAQACGLDLSVRLAKYDDSYVALVDAQLRLDPAERLRRLLATAQLDLAEIAAALARHRVHYVLIGSLAGALHGSPVIPGDLRVTVVPATDAVNEKRLRASLMALNAKAQPLENRYSGLHDIELWEVPDAGGEVGVVRSPAGSHGYKDLRRDAVMVELSRGVSVPVASPADLVRIAEASPWSFDRAQVPALRTTLERTRQTGPEKRARSRDQRAAA